LVRKRPIETFVRAIFEKLMYLGAALAFVKIYGKARTVPISSRKH